MNNPYEILNVNKEATPEDIKKAFKKAAKKNHPDKGGDQIKMQEINKAYALLKNQDLRDKFDRTGQCDDHVDNKQSQIAQVVASIVEQMIMQNPNSVKAFLTDLEFNNKKTIEVDNSKLLSQRSKIETLQRRILKKPDKDIIGIMLNNKISDLNMRMKVNEEKLDNIIKAINFVKEYSFKDAEQRQSYIIQNDLGTTSFNFGSI